LDLQLNDKHVLITGGSRGIGYACAEEFLREGCSVSIVGRDPARLEASCAKLDPTRERVTFVLRPGESILRRDAGGGAQPIINGVKRFTLTYFDAAGLATTDPAAVASIRIQIEVGRAGPSVAMRTQAALRNRGG